MFLKFLYDVEVKPGSNRNSSDAFSSCPWKLNNTTTHNHAGIYGHVILFLSFSLYGIVLFISWISLTPLSFEFQVSILYSFVFFN